MKKKHDEIASIKREENYSKQWFTEGLKLLKEENKNFKDIVDIGVGRGEFLQIVKNNFATSRLVGIDYTETNLKILKSKGFQSIKIDLDNFTIDKYTSLKNKFDLAICLETIEHIFNTDELFHFFYYLLKKNGSLLISTPNTSALDYKLFYLLRGYPLGENHHVRFLTPKKINQYAFFNGFEIVKWKNYLTPPKDIIRRGLGIRNKQLIFFLTLFIFIPLSIMRKIIFFKFLANNHILVLCGKSKFHPLGLEVHNFKENFKKLSRNQKNTWIKRIRKYYKTDKLREHFYFGAHIKKIINK